MSTTAISAVGVLDEAVETVRRNAGPWLGVLWLTALPLRLLQARFFVEAFRLGEAASGHGAHLGVLALQAMLVFPVAVWGRAVFVRACQSSSSARGAAGAEAWRVPAPTLAATLYTALVGEVLFYLLGCTLLGLPLAVAFAGLGAAVATRIRAPGLVEPLREVLSCGRYLGSLAALLFVHAIALALAWINLYFAFVGGIWVVSGALGIDAGAWERLFRPAQVMGLVSLPWPAETLPRLLLLSGAALAVEPFWVAAASGFAQRVSARRSGEDLRAWFRSLRAEDAA